MSNYNPVNRGIMRYVVATLFVTTILYGQRYFIKKWAFSSAGDKLTSTTYILYSAAGQPVTGVSHNGYIEQAGFYTHEMIIIVGIKEDHTHIPEVFFITPPYPNPGYYKITLTYGVPVGTHVTIKVYDIAGRTVATLVDKPHTPGYYGVECVLRSALPAGVYFIVMHADEFIGVRKLLMFK